VDRVEERKAIGVMCKRVGKDRPVGGGVSYTIARETRLREDLVEAIAPRARRWNRRGGRRQTRHEGRRARVDNDATVARWGAGRTIATGAAEDDQREEPTSCHREEAHVFLLEEIIEPRSAWFERAE
jgi:hypothetical protein